jgi:eukaryotic-like serine/threonine-protein kinase
VSTSSRSAFEQCALASGLLTQEHLDEARASVRWSEGDQPDNDAPPSDRQLADRLVELARINAWQARQLLDGRTKFNLGPYWIVDSLGQGGMGQVFKAEHGILGRVVAVKVLPRAKSTPEAIDNFNREIRALASLDHPRLVRALDAGHDGNVYYLVTEYVPGADLRKLIRRSGPLGMEAAAGIISQVAEGLAHAHGQGLIHRDVKPGNVLVTPEGEAKLSDLGLAGPLDRGAETDPRFGKIVGTADYLSPDHVRDPWNPTAAWDIYSLGCTLYYAVTGKVPFPGGTTAEKARAHCELRPLDPRRLNPRLTSEFVDVLADMMAKDPAQRIPSAIDVMRRLEPWARRSVGARAAPGRRGPNVRFPARPIPVSPEMLRAAPPVAPPPVLAVPPPRRAEPPAPPGGPAAPVRDTEPNFPDPAEFTSDSQESASVIVPTTDAVPARRSFRSGTLRDRLRSLLARHRMLLAATALTAVALAAVVVIVWVVARMVRG